MAQRVVVQFVIRMMRCRVSAPGNGIYANEGMVMPFVGTVFIVVEHRFNGLHLTGFHRIRKQFFMWQLVRYVGCSFARKVRSDGSKFNHGYTGLP